MQTNKPSVEKLLARKRIPPRALRVDTPGGTIWVPRWKWAGRIFGHEVRLPATPGGSRALGPAPCEGTDTTSAPREEVVSSSAEVAEKAQAKTTKEDSAKVEDREPWRVWAVPLLAILAVLVCTYALGVTFGFLLAIGHPPYWIAGGWVGALLRAPSGALLLLLAALACFVQASDERGTRRIWQVSGGMLLVFSLLATFGGIL
ncbi:hypothetical protein AAE485_07635 [Acidithiobacillus ferriphilus]|uniref:hypothetical protein n=1 Tax=Acidithiobacillus TaxID=119977 RepID=UPI0021490A7E|nr:MULTISPECIES: hypothetical protein [Acidithiobacillus]MCR1345463.1 hypothetical protein [Acidithiobacillus ferrooxidans]MCR1355840.1 hypothetical protein [Acidithiobacillus ferrooxidans]MEB8475522.1 hypothetical protein [Acidithiobacillus ferriphilus]